LKNCTTIDPSVIDPNGAFDFFDLEKITDEYKVVDLSSVDETSGLMKTDNNMELMDEELYNELSRIVQEADLLIKENLADNEFVAVDHNEPIVITQDQQQNDYGDLLLLEEINSIHQMSSSLELEFVDNSMLLQNADPMMMTYY
jgi:hypothetical protein